MEFKFKIQEVLPTTLTKVTNSLVPQHFLGDQKLARDCASKISDILDEMGVASGKAQDLKKPITSGEKLKNSDHIVYFLTDEEGKSGNGSIVGLLKVGFKNLYLFDSRGVHHQVQALCILDFYVHESKQRMGCGKILYEFMLKEEKVKPEHLAIDRPSDKFIHFLYKHYGLKTIIPQCNHYVVFDKFFTNNKAAGAGNVVGNADEEIVVRARPQILASYPPMTVGEGCNGLQPDTFGRHAASKPICSMGKILHEPTVEKVQISRSGSISSGNSCGFEDVGNLQGSSQLLDEEVLNKSLFLHSRLW